MSSDEEMSQSQLKDISPQELSRLANIIANVFLTSDLKKNPLKRADLIKVIPKEHTRKLNVIIKEASNILCSTYGYKIIEIKKSFILKNQLGNQLNESECIQINEKEALYSCLRTLILAMIFMNGGTAHEGILKSFLLTFDINMDSKETHPAYGNTNLLITRDFVRQGYLELNEVKDVDPMYKEFKWGERSHLEVDKMKILNFVCKMYGESTKPEMWLDQFKEAQRCED